MRIGCRTHSVRDHLVTRRWATPRWPTQTPRAGPSASDLPQGGSPQTLEPEAGNQRAGLLVEDVLAGKDVEGAILDRAVWRGDERRGCREGRLPRPGWWPGR